MTTPAPDPGCLTCGSPPGKGPHLLVKFDYQTRDWFAARCYGCNLKNTQLYPEVATLPVAKKDDAWERLDKCGTAVTLRQERRHAAFRAWIKAAMARTMRRARSATRATHRPTATSGATTPADSSPAPVRTTDVRGNAGSDSDAR